MERMGRLGMGKAPNDPSWARLLALALSGKGDAVGCNAVLRKIAARSPTAYDQNAYAWDSLIIGVHDDRVLAAARSAVNAARNSHTLNTLAAVQAARGEVDAARATLVAAVDLASDGVPRASDWMIMGQIAQQLGYRVAAYSMYQRVHDDRGAGQGVYALAQRWLSELATAPAAAP